MLKHICSITERSRITVGWNSPGFEESEKRNMVDSSRVLSELRTQKRTREQRILSYYCHSLVGCL
jgi:hypothetical protein